jgi:hypothetical protein
VTGWPLWIHANNNRIQIAISHDAYDLLSIAGGFSFMPEALTAPAEKTVSPRSRVLIRLSQLMYATVSTSPDAGGILHPLIYYFFLLSNRCP